MNAGRLRHRVTLQRAVDTVDDTTGAASKSWTDLGSWRCEIKPANGREAFIDGGIMAESSVLLIGRRNSVVASLTAADRAVSVDGVTLYNIAAPGESSNDNRTITLRARTGINDGR